ncbi:MAG: von Willebrand factor type A domain-containing protein [Verrucomicrobiota bacterium]|nr:von Willebrand factor type A domain-containing protein [Verrucomicrobiota bacterium]
MKIDLNNPKLTAFALGELPESEQHEMKTRVAQSPEAQQFVADTRMLADALTAEFAEELRRPDERPGVLPVPFAQLFQERQRAVLAIAAVLITAVAISAALVRTHHSSREAARTDAVEFWDGEPKTPASSRAFVSVATRAADSFPLQIGTGSYEKVRRALEAGIRPSPADVHVAEMVNAFAYTYPEPADAAPAAIHIDAATCPWRTDARLVRIGIRASHGADRAEVVLRDARVTVNFNPARCSAFRLVGYEEGNASSATPAGYALRSDDQITALYEIIPATAQAGNLLSVELTYRNDRAQTGTIAQVFVDDGRAFMSADFRFAAAVAEFGLILRGSPEKGSATIAHVLRVAEATRGSDGQREVFVDCVRKAEALAL